MGWQRTLEPVAGYLVAAAGVALVTAAIGPLLARFRVANISMLYLVVVLVAAVRYGRSEAIFASVTAFFAFNWFHIEPLHTFTVKDPNEWLALLLFLVVALVTGHLAARQRRQAYEAHLLRATDQIRQAVLASVSHDLRTPLASIKASAESLAQRTIHWTDEER